MRFFWIYVIVELTAVVALAWTVGVGRTLLILLATFLVGLALAGSQIRRQVNRLRAGLTTPQGAISDSSLVALGTVLVVVPGLVTALLGLLVLLPPTRMVARPIVTFLAMRRIGRVSPRGDYVDGEVIVPPKRVGPPLARGVPPVTDIEPPLLPRAPE